MNDHERTSVRLRKFIPQPTRYAERYGNFQLTGRDLDVLELVLRYRHVTADHIRALIPGSSERLGRRLAGLFHNNYLGRYVPLDRMRFDLNAGSPVMAYGLETKGWRTLQDRGRAPAGDGTHDWDSPTWRKEYSRRRAWFLEHHLGISNFRCVLELALRDQARGKVNPFDWDQSAAIRGRVALRTGEVVRVNPDSYFFIRDHDGAGRNYFLEFDSGSEEQRRIEEKYRSYWLWLQSPSYRAAHRNHERVAVLFVTTGPKRMTNMMATLARLPKPSNPPFGGRGWFRFCLASDYDLSDPQTILSPIWRSVGHEDKRDTLL